MNDQKHLKLLRLVIKDNLDKIEDLLKKEDLDFNVFKNFVSVNLLAGNIYPVLINPQIKNYFPDTLIEHLKFSYMLQWTSNEKLIAGMGRLAELFQNTGKDVIFLKGPLLALRFFGNIDRRTIADIDILAKNEDLNDIDRLLEAFYYRHMTNTLLNNRITRKFVHHFEYRKQDTVLELHWVFSRHFSFHLDHNKIWQQKKKVIVNDKSFFVLSDEYELVFQIVSALRDIESGNISVRSFQDIYVILKAINRNTDWRQFFDDRKKEGLFSISLNILDLVLSILECYEEFIALSCYMENKTAYIRYKSMDDKLKLIKHSRFALKNKIWTFALYDTHICKAFCWWAVSLPFRLIIHKEKSLNLLRN